MATATRGRPRLDRRLAKAGVTVTGRTHYTGARLTFAERALLEAYAEQSTGGDLTKALRELMNLGLETARERGMRVTIVGGVGAE
jgi:hypothetical protein